MKSTLEKIVTVTSKGQITLPIDWRKSNSSKQVLIRSKGNKIEITPITISKNDSTEYTVFDAIRDNNGVGIKAKDLVDILDKKTG